MHITTHEAAHKGNPEYFDTLINEVEAAKFLGYTVRALQNWRVRGGGPVFIKVSARSVRYRRRDLIAWADELAVTSTSAFQN
ncbi:helix-turn-helix transcriptional regulator [Thalassospira povalilytica]|uniref:helix-turn-helix transcriptional regulator n=1 Tax=Thalassospira povalilytica TaxID=732237 RepID=UPI001D1821DE|nr:helix-turn-helix domain-containing protein [Thalassospira povalilytica]MCC4242757.1 helix-turn-helix domain-containing protein [Thalassospira povalilytica]